MGASSIVAKQTVEHSACGHPSPGPGRILDSFRGTQKTANRGTGGPTPLTGAQRLDLLSVIRSHPFVPYVFKSDKAHQSLRPHLARDEAVGEITGLDSVAHWGILPFLPRACVTPQLSAWGFEMNVLGLGQIGSLGCRTGGSS